jgi:hypothetical protein
MKWIAVTVQFFVGSKEAHRFGALYEPIYSSLKDRSLGTRRCLHLESPNQQDRLIRCSRSATWRKSIMAASKGKKIEAKDTNIGGGTQEKRTFGLPAVLLAFVVGRDPALLVSATRVRTQGDA